jgi:hypothetical protein
MTVDDVDRGTPGGSLLRICERRRANHERRIRGQHPRLGGLILALTDEPATTTNFRGGARAEAWVAQRLHERVGPEVELLFNRRLSARGRDGAIDVLALAPYPGVARRMRRPGPLHSEIRAEVVVHLARHLPPA